jgi:hypothetical protein
MYLLVNGRNFETFRRDTEASISRRIAHQFNTLPDWINLTGNLFGPNGTEITLIDIRDELKGKRKGTIIELYDKYSDIFPNISLRDFALLWFRKNYTEKDIEEFVKYVGSHEFLLEDLRVSIYSDYKSNTDLIFISSWDRFSEELKRFDKENKGKFVRLRRDILDDERSVNDLQVAYHNMPPFGTFKVLSTVLGIKVNIIKKDEKNQDIFSVFYRLRASVEVPLIILNSMSFVRTFFKVSPKIPTFEKWIKKFVEERDFAARKISRRRRKKITNDFIYMKILEKPFIDEDTIPDYVTTSSGRLIVDPLDKRNRQLEVDTFTDTRWMFKSDEEISVHVRVKSESDVDERTIVNRTIQDVGIPVEETVVEVKGEFIVVNLSINPTAFYEMVTNDETLSGFLVLNEIRVIASSRANIQCIFYQFFEGEPTNVCNMLITEKTVGIGSEITIGGDHLTIGSTYTVVKLSKLRGSFLDSINSKLIPLIVALFNRYRIMEAGILENIREKIGEEKKVEKKVEEIEEEEKVEGEEIEEEEEEEEEVEEKVAKKEKKKGKKGRRKKVEKKVEEKEKVAIKKKKGKKEKRRRRKKEKRRRKKEKRRRKKEKRRRRKKEKIKTRIWTKINGT